MQDNVVHVGVLLGGLSSYMCCIIYWSATQAIDYMLIMAELTSNTNRTSCSPKWFVNVESDSRDQWMC